MKTHLLCCFLFFHVESRPNSDSTILNYHNKITENGYEFGFLTSDGIERSETGQLTSSGGDFILNVNGDYSYTSPDGSSISVKFTSGENGYWPKVEIGNKKGVGTAYAAQARPISTAAIASLAGGRK